MSDVKLDKSRLPKHVGIIMDGNRRWAKKRGLGAVRGHNYVVNEVLEPLIDKCIELSIPYLTLWAFSTENWKRDKREVEGLMQLFRRAMGRRAEDLVKKGVKFRVLGDLEAFPEDIAEQARGWIEQSKNNDKIEVALALSYGGRDEIVRAVNKAVKSGKEVTEESFAELVDTAGMPDPDLIIRPGGEKRLSGFMTWQSVYAELYFTDVLMPEFTVEEFEKALEEYERRQRRFGN